MCNFIHVDHVVPEEKSGRAWKVFEIIDSNLTSMAAGCSYRKNGQKTMGKDWVTWNEKDIGNGFCLIPDYKEACRLLTRWKGDHRYSYCVVEVEYKKAVSLQMEDNIFSVKEKPFEVLIVKKFRPVKTWEDYV